MTREYTSKEIEILSKEFEKETNLLDLERILEDRSCYGILRKLQHLSKNNPDKWDSDRVIEYVRQYRQQHKDESAERSKQYHQQHKDESAERNRQYKLRRKLNMCKLISDISDIRDIGYEIGKITKDNGTITIKFLEEGLNMLSVKKDFEEHVQEVILNSKVQDLYYGFQLDYKENNLFISPRPNVNERGKVESFLKVYELILEIERSKYKSFV